MNNKEKIIRLSKNGLSRQVIAKKLGMTWTAVNLHLNPALKTIEGHRKQARGRKLVKELKLQRGGKCQKCEYNKCFEALHFHHRYPSEKKFSLSNGFRRGVSAIKKESNKCDLLCANCHIELTYQHKKELNVQD